MTGMTIINNYEMPSNCYMCDLHNYHECDLTGESIEEDYCWNGDKREKHCPLREVKAIPKDQYENRLKADMMVTLDKIRADVKNGIHHFLDGEPIIEIKEVLQIIDKYKADRSEEE